MRGKLKMMKNKFIYLIPVLSFVFLKTTAQNTNLNTFTNITPQKLQVATNNFRNINFSDPQLYSSGLVYDLIERQFWSIQNSRLDENSKLKETNSSKEEE